MCDTKKSPRKMNPEELFEFHLAFMDNRWWFGSISVALGQPWFSEERRVALIQLEEETGDQP